MPKVQLVAGTTSYSTMLFIQDAKSAIGAGKASIAYNTSGLSAYYVRPGSAAAQITLATQTPTGAFSSGGFCAVDNTNLPGIYRLDVPDAVLAAGAKSAVIMLKGAANMVPVALEIELTGWNNQDAVRGGMSALPNAAAEAAGGLITRGTGTGQLSVTSGAALADAVAISGDSVAADNLEAQYDGTGIIGSNYPAYQAQVRDIAVTGSALNTTAESFTKTYGTEVGTYANTLMANGVYHEIVAENAGSNPRNIDGYYEFSIGTGQPVEVSILGRLVEGAPPYGGDSVDTYAYNWAGASWDHISPATGDFLGSNSTTDVVKTMGLLNRHVGTGVNAGKVRIRLEGTSLESGTTLYIDQIIVRYAIPLTANEVADAFLNRNVAGGSSAGYLVKHALFFLRCQWSVDESNVLTVKDPTGTTAWQANVITDGSGNIIGLTPI